MNGWMDGGVSGKDMKNFFLKHLKNQVMGRTV